MVNCEIKIAIGEELQTLFHPIVSATKQAAEKTAEELGPVKKALEDIDGALKAQQQHTIPPHHHRMISHLVYMQLGMDGIQYSAY